MLNQFTNQELADAYGEAKAALEAAQLQADAIKDEIRRRGITEARGLLFRVTVTEQIQGRPDIKGLREHLGDLFSRFEIPSVTNVVRVKPCAKA